MTSETTTDLASLARLTAREIDAAAAWATAIPGDETSARPLVVAGALARILLDAADVPAVRRAVAAAVEAVTLDIDEARAWADALRCAAWWEEETRPGGATRAPTSMAAAAAREEIR